MAGRGLPPGDLFDLLPEDRDPDALQALLDEHQTVSDELERLRARDLELLVEISALLRRSPRRRLRLRRPVPRIRRRDTFPRDSSGNLLYLGDRVRFRGTARTGPGFGVIVGWSARYLRIERDYPPQQRWIGSRIVHRHPDLTTLSQRGPNAPVFPPRPLREAASSPSSSSSSSSSSEISEIS